VVVDQLSGRLITAAHDGARVAAELAAARDIASANAAAAGVLIRSLRSDLDAKSQDCARAAAAAAAGAEDVRSVASQSLVVIGQKRPRGPSTDRSDSGSPQSNGPPESDSVQDNASHVDSFLGPSASQVGIRTATPHGSRTGASRCSHTGSCLTEAALAAGAAQPVPEPPAAALPKPAFKKQRVTVDGQAARAKKVSLQTFLHVTTAGDAEAPFPLAATKAGAAGVRRRRLVASRVPAVLN
jgi:hypothetical protein